MPLDSLQDKHKIWNPSGRPLSRSQRYMPHVSASRPNSFSRCAEPPPRPPSRSRRTASRRGRSPALLGQRAGGLRCSRLHSGVCSHSPRLLPVRSRLPHKSQFTRILYLASASPSPRICWAVRPSQASIEKLVPIWAWPRSTARRRACPSNTGLRSLRFGRLPDGTARHGSAKYPPDAASAWWWTIASAARKGRSCVGKGLDRALRAGRILAGSVRRVSAQDQERECHGRSDA